MALLFLSPDDPADAWRAELQARIPDLDVPEVGDRRRLTSRWCGGRRRAS